MALHGVIAINGRPIGEWSAVRQQHPPQEVNDYKVEVSYREPGLLGEVHTVEGMLSHRFGDGAVTLAAEVLTWAAPLLPPRLAETG